MHDHRYLMKGTFMCEESILGITFGSNMLNVQNDVHDIEI